MRLRHRLLLAYARRELPGWGRVYAGLGGNDDARWHGSGVRTVRGKLHGFEMELDIENWSERLTWFLGRYHDLALQLMVRRLLQPGDCFVDIGANLGMLSLLASAAVGASGRVIAFEPNPRLIARFQRTLDRNQVGNVELVHAAISDQPGTAKLHEYGGHPGWGSLSDCGPEGAAETATFIVPLQSGDDLLAATDPEQPMLIKIDVEGHEVPVLRSLQQTLPTRWPLVICEYVEAHQQRAGHSAAELRGELERHGYRAFALETRRRMLGHDVELRPLRHDESREVDAVFLPPKGPWTRRSFGVPS
ncbi:MAG: FkbM family methyltransferase [Planctomycetota bacterium]|jgi:FkbM family methyltransferase